MKSLLIFVIVLVILPSCEQCTAPECCNTDFCIVDLDVEFIVDKEGDVFLHVFYKYRFKREGRITYQIQNSILTGYRKDPYSHDETYVGGIHTYSGGFGTGGKLENPDIKFTMVTVGFEGTFYDCPDESPPFYNNCSFHWEKTLVVPVQHYEED